MFKHETVLLNESVDSLNIKPDGVYVDATLGGAGHSSLILSKLSSDGKLICFDQDIWAINNAKKKFVDNKNVYLVESNFANLRDCLSELGIDKIDGILFDLGVSSMQIDSDERGFSYIHDGPLDMRMNQSSPFSAQNIIDEYSAIQLETIFKKYGEEKFSRLIANVIVETRDENPITTTLQLSELILNKIPKKFFYGAKSHPAKRIFQALRIEVNRELDVFEDTVKDAFDILNSGGRISVITFHSLEDRICKYYFKKWSELSDDLKSLPMIPDELKAPGKKVTTKPILPSTVELENNSRSRSAKLRVIERV